jgi:hypothetical protein
LLWRIALPVARVKGRAPAGWRQAIDTVVSFKALGFASRLKMLEPRVPTKIHIS